MNYKMQKEKSSKIISWLNYYKPRLKIKKARSNKLDLASIKYKTLH